MERSESALVALRRILRTIDGHGRDVARAAGLTPVQARVLYVLSTSGVITQRRLAEELRVSQATVSVLLDKLQAKGLVRRERSARDRRQIDLVLSEEGARILTRAPDPLQDRFVSRFSALPDAEQSRILAALERVAQLLDADRMEAAPLLEAGDLTGQEMDLPGAPT